MRLFSRCFLALALGTGVFSPYPDSTAFAQGLPDLTGGAFSARPQAADRPKVTIETAASRTSAAPGDEIVLAITMRFAEGWHAWPAEELKALPPEIDEFAIHTSLALSARPEWAGAIGRTQWPLPKPAPVADFNNPGKTITVPLFKEVATVFVPVIVADSAVPGPASITFTLAWQACDEKVCEQPEEKEITFPIEIVQRGSAGAGPVALDAEPFRAFDASAFARMRAGEVAPGPAAPAQEQDSSPLPPEASTFFGVSLSGLTGAGGFAILALLGMVGGFILNLTPCVLPVIPIKVLTLTKHAGSPGRSLVLGLFMAAGVIAFWLALGIPAAFITALADPSRLFGIWWLTTAIGLLIGLMGLGILGLFSINLPQAVYLVNPETESPAGSFLFGVMTAVLGLPCFGFVAGALLPVAASFGPAATIIIFGAMGVGMALPYLVLAARPQLVERLPRTGPASELVKQVMGLLLLAAAAYFIGSGLIALVQEEPYLGKLLHWWAAAGFAALAGLWLILRTFQISSRSGPRLAMLLLGAAIGGLAFLAAIDRTRTVRDAYLAQQATIAAAEGSGALITGAWIPYSESLHRRALEERKVVVMDFTAEWCLNCKALKAAVLARDPVRSALMSPDTVLFEVDLTSTKAPGWKQLRAFGQTGIPLLVIQGPGLAEPWMSNAYTPDQVLRALADARE